MLEAKISVEQHHCSLATVTKGTGIELDILSHIPLSDTCMLFLVEEKNRGSSTPKYLKDIEEHESTESLELLQVSSEKALFLAAIGDSSAVHAFEESHCFIKYPIHIRNGNKYYTIIAPDMACLNRAYDRLKKLGKWSIDEVYFPDDDSNKDSLTGMQKKVLLTAKGMGYFDSPRKVSIEDVGKALGISKSTAHHHLLEAKKKLVLKYTSELSSKQQSGRGSESKT